MPKNTRLGGTSHDGVIPAPAPKAKPWTKADNGGTSSFGDLVAEGGTGGAVTVTVDCGDEPDTTATVTGADLVDDEGGEEPSPGSSSPTSSEEPTKKSAPSSTPNRLRARTTANPSKKTPKGTSDAPSTDGPTSSN